MPDLEKGLIGHWTLNDADTDGSTIRDRSAYDNHGTLKNTVNTSFSSSVGRAFEFLGDQPSGSTETNPGSVRVSRTNTLSPKSQFTISGWIYKYIYDQTNNGASLFWNDGDAGATVEPRNNGVRVNMGGNYSQVEAGDIPANQWAHVCATYDNGSLKLYIDNTVVDSNTSVPEPSYNNNQIYIGRRNGHYTHTFNGLISDVRTYNRALSQSEINQLYNFRGNSRKSQTTAVASDSLQAWYPFLQSGAADKSGNGNDGTVNGATYNGSGGPEGLGGYEFDGSSSDYIDTTSSSNRILDQIPVTGSAWFYPQSNGSVDKNNIVSSDDPGNYGHGFGYNTNGNISVEYHDGFWNTGVSAAKDQWHLGTLVYNSGGKIDFYLDGELKASNTVSYAAMDGTSYLRIGYHNSGRHYFDGEISDVRIYDKALSQSEVKQLYDPQSVNLDRGLVGHWSMDDRDVSGGTLYDRSAYGNHGTVNGPTVVSDGMDFEESNNDNIDIGVVGNELEFGNGDFSVSTRATFDTTGSYRTLLELSRYSESLLLRPSGSNCEIYIDGNSWKPNVGFSAGNTYDVTVTRSNGIVELYIDGVSQGTNNNLDGNMNITQTSNIGQSVHNDGQSHDGIIHFMRIYNRALTEKEINALYNKRNTTSINSPSIITESFESGSSISSLSENWNIGNGNISSARQYTGSNSFGSWGDGSVDARWNVFPNGQAQIDEFSYWWKEDSSQTGHQVRLYDSNDNEVQRSETENPQWQLSDGTGSMDTLASPGYNNWTLFQFEFDWAAGTYDYFLQDENGTTRTGTRNLIRSTNVSYIDIVGTSGNYCRFDDLEIKL